MKVRIDLDQCHRSGECCYNHPELFEMSDDGEPSLKMTDLADAGMRLRAEQAAEVCPAGAILIEA
ncbi:MAG: ferredoxin [Gammaproteobacteria bacterium]|nr:ferredoxin [Gammaproteobacteria bacterium]MCY4344892.1 ferredoxin [Gammaproteobacteria bacterium]